MIKAVLFDLDGTLLPMDQDVFVKAYFGGLVKKAAPFGYEPEKLVQTIWTGTKAMVQNDGQLTNEEVFWQVFLVTEDLINSKNADITEFPQGILEDVMEWETLFPMGKEKG